MIGPRAVLGAVILAIALLYTLALFPGLEWYSGYFGYTYKTLHPESFPADKYMPAGNPTSLSSYYLLVRLVGDLWLDDRFTMAVFLGLVVLALVGVDRTAWVLGAERLEERLLVIALMALGHRFRDNIAIIVTNADFYAGTFAGVAAIWLIYLALSGARPWWILGGVLVLGTLNARWAWFPSLLALTLMARERLSRRGQAALLAGAVTAGVLAWAVYAAWLRPPGGEHAWVFDDLVRREGSEVNPFLDAPLANLKYFVLLGLGLLIAVPAEAQRRRVRTVVALGALLWVAGGVYLSHAPDLLKVPYLAALAPNRATQWPQYVLFLSIAVGALVMMREASMARRLAGVLVLATLYATFSPLRMLRFGLVWGALLVVALWWDRRTSRAGAAGPGGGWLGRCDVVKVSAAALLFLTLGAYGKAAVERYPDLRFLARHGVMGGHPSAKWVGVDEFVRRNTEVDATILPLADGDYPWRRGLMHETSLRIRTGRSTPMGPRSAILFDYRRLKELETDRRHMDRMLEAWRSGDVQGVERELEHFKPVDYIIVDGRVAGPIQDRLTDYRVQASIGKFTILRRQDRGARMAAPSIRREGSPARPREPLA